MIKRASREPNKPVYWSAIEPVYGKIEAVYKELLRESKQVLKSLHETWQALTEKRMRKEITLYEEEKARLRAEAWKALKEKYNKALAILKGILRLSSESKSPSLRLTTYTLIVVYDYGSGVLIVWAVFVV
ncbi:MAG: hypothetical protein QXK12_03195 [Candidatus Nezhaarchaeales archaeon]